MSTIVGLAYEGNRDLEALKVIIMRLAADFGQDFQFSDHKYGINNAHTAILKYVKTFTQYMFDEANVDYAFYFTDQDEDPESRSQQIAKKIEEYNPSCLPKSFIGVPIPHFEVWLTADEDIVKSVLSYDHTKPLLFSDMSPKNQLQALVQNSREDIMLEDCKIKIATDMNFNVLIKKHIGFKEFYESFRHNVIA